MSDLRIISPRQHGIIDYIYSATLLLAPKLFDFSHHRIPSTIARLFGAGALGISLLTRYELSLAKIIPLRLHLILDVISTALLAASPFLFGFKHRRRNAWMPHLLIGLLSLPIPFLTRDHTEEALAKLAPSATLPLMTAEEVEVIYR